MDNVEQLWNLFTKNKILIFNSLFTASVIHLSDLWKREMIDSRCLLYRVKRKHQDI